MSPRTLGIVTLAGGAVLLGVLLFFFFGGGKSQPKVSPTATPGALPTSGIRPIPTGTTITIEPSKGQSAVVVRNFYQDAEQITPEKDASIRKNDRYQIFYFNQSQEFVILILDAPLEANRQEAEREFLDALRITEDDACKLTVALQVPYNVNPDKAGQDFGLSFCPGSISL